VRGRGINDEVMGQEWGQNRKPGPKTEPDIMDMDGWMMDGFDFQSMNERWRWRWRRR
jgi:hypothetical protein